MSDREIITPGRALLLLLTLAIAAQAEPVRAGVLDFQAQTEYDFAQVKRKGTSATGIGHFSTDYTLTLRRPFLPASSLMSDLTFKGIDSSDSNFRQNSRGWTLNLYSTDPKYMLSSRIDHNSYTTSSGLSTKSTGYTTNYHADLLLRQPAYPAVSLQFQRQTSGTNYGGASGNYTTSTWLMSSYYDMAPLRFTVDRSRQRFDYSGANSIQMGSQSSAITLNRSLMTGLTVYGELSHTATDVKYSASSSSTDTNRRVLRLTVTPLRSLVADISLESQADRQKVGLVSGTNDNALVSWSVRSEILPGLSLDASDDRQTQSGRAYFGYPSSVSRNRSVALTARFSDAALFSVSNTRSDFDVSTTIYHATQESLQSTLQASLSPTTDLNLNYGRSKSSAGGGDLFDSSVEGLLIRDRTSRLLSVGASFRRNRLRSEVSGGEPLLQYGDTADVDVSWQPRYDVGLDLRMSHQNNTGSGAYKSFAPSGNLRWQITSATNFTANYSLQRYRPFDPTNVGLLGQDTRGLSMRLTHRIARGATLDIAYDFQASNITDIEWHRQLRMGFVLSPSSY
ncbi:MAG TPA: hypothetical protein VGM51_15115 [Armatimonadota bacterium]